MYTIYKEDYELAKKLGHEIKNRPSIAQDASRLSSLLADVLKGSTPELNVLRALVNERIIDRLQTQESNDSLYNRYVLILEQRYGISNAITQRMVWIWLYSYRSLVLGKAVPYQIVSNGPSMPHSGNPDQQSHNKRLPTNGSK